MLVLIESIDNKHLSTFPSKSIYDMLILSLRSLPESSWIGIDRIPLPLHGIHIGRPLSEFSLVNQTAHTTLDKNHTLVVCVK